MAELKKTQSYTLELSYEEVAALTAITGKIVGAGKLRDLANTLFHSCYNTVSGTDTYESFLNQVETEMYVEE